MNQTFLFIYAILELLARLLDVVIALHFDTSNLA